MNLRLKQVFFITGFIVIVLAMALGLYWFFFRSKPPTSPTEIQPGVSGQLPQTGSTTTTATAPTTTPSGFPTAQGVPRDLTLPTGVPRTGRTRVLIPGVMRSLSMSAQGARAYNPADGKFYRITPDGQATPLSSQVFFNVESVDWGNRSDKAIINYPDGSNILYDFTTDKQADRKSTRLNSSHTDISRMPSSA